MRRQIVHKKRRKQYPVNVPKKLFQLFRSLGYSITKLADHRGVNSGHVSKLLNDGIEPSDRNPASQQIRIKLFLSRKKRKVKDKIVSYDIKEQPDYIKKWRHLPTEERHTVIKSHLDTKRLLEKMKGINK